MAKKPLPTPGQLRQLLRYEAETGKLFWRERGIEWFADGGHTAAHNCAAWNKKYAGTEALAAISTNGYRYGRVFRMRVAAHRAIWAMAHGEWPAGDLDHINCVKTDNRLENLRVVSHEENMRNVPRRRDNVSGITGVHWQSRRGKWRAEIQGERLGMFDSLEEAAAARAVAMRLRGFHANHGQDIAR